MKPKDRTTVTPVSELISLKNKKALITGSGTGIGEAIALRFAEAGASLQLVDVNEERPNKVKEKLEPFHTEIAIHKVDLSSKEEIDTLWAKLKGKEPSILVNNAGIYPTNPS